MASSKVMTSSTSRNSDLRQRSSPSASTKSSSIPALHVRDNHNNYLQRINKNSSNIESNSKNSGPVILDGVYGDIHTAESALMDAEITLLDAAGAVTAISDNEANGRSPRICRQESSVSNNAVKKTVDDVWREIVAGRIERRECKQEAPDEMMTLEDFLVKTGAVDEPVKEEQVSLRAEKLSGGIFSFDSMPLTPLLSQQSVDGVVGFGNVVEVTGGRGKRRAVLEPIDKAAQQRQRRMIKNRESAARSRERKQAYQFELETLAVKLEEENEKLLKQKAEQTRERFKQLMEKVVPVLEKRRPPRVLRRVHSMHW